MTRVDELLAAYERGEMSFMVLFYSALNVAYDEEINERKVA